MMVETSRIKAILSKFSELKVAVLGDFFLDLYIEMDRSLSEFSLETHKEAFQAFATREQPGAAGVVAINLSALGAQASAICVLGDDGNGFALKKALVNQGINTDKLVEAENRLTPTYIKPIMKELDGSSHELNRMDLINRSPIDNQVNQTLLRAVKKAFTAFDGILVLEQIKNDGCGTLSPLLRANLRKLAEENPEKVVLVDSRHFPNAYQGIPLKLNVSEAQLVARELNPTKDLAGKQAKIEACAQITQAYWSKYNQSIFITLGADGICGRMQGEFYHIPGYQFTGPVDPVGAGDSVLAAIGLALAAGATSKEAAYIGNLVGSITVQQVGTTGFATQDMLFQRHLEYQNQISHKE